MSRFSRETQIKLAAIVLLLVVAVAMYMLGKDIPEQAPIIGFGPPPTITPIPPTPTLPDVILPAPTPSP